MTKEEKWMQICKEVDKRVEEEYFKIPIGKRKQLGVEPNKNGSFNDSETYDRNRWLVCYINLLEWQKMTKSMITND